MIERHEDKDVITVDLEAVFGRVVMLSAYQAEKSIEGDNPVVLVMEAVDTPLFLAHLDPVVADIKPLLISRMDGQGMTVTNTEIIIELQKDVISKEGLEIIDRALPDALTSGVLAGYQSGARGYERVAEHNGQRYREALKQVSHAGTFRTRPKDKIRIRQRYF